MAQKDGMFDIPGYNYFDSGNDYTGGCRDFRYKLFLKEEALHAAFWQDDLCFEKCSLCEEREFPADEEGLAAAVAWLKECARR